MSHQYGANASEVLQNYKFFPNEQLKSIEIVKKSFLNLIFAHHSLTFYDKLRASFHLLSILIRMIKDSGETTLVGSPGWSFYSLKVDKLFLMVNIYDINFYGILFI